jgi:pyruvate/2-oxoglutarate dehydrogenase complex dihydrolipoamide acyltransferase (E2) component
MSIVQVRMPQYPECWETCGSCASGKVFVLEVHVKAGDVVRFDDNLITLETGKVALDIPSPVAGTIVDVVATEGGDIAEGEVIVTLDTP